MSYMKRNWLPLLTEKSGKICDNFLTLSSMQISIVGDNFHELDFSYYKANYDRS